MEFVLIVENIQENKNPYDSSSDEDFFSTPTSSSTKKLHSLKQGNNIVKYPKLNIFIHETKVILINLSKQAIYFKQNPKSSMKLINQPASDQLQLSFGEAHAFSSTVLVIKFLFKTTTCIIKQQKIASSSPSQQSCDIKLYSKTQKRSSFNQQQISHSKNITANFVGKENQRPTNNLSVSELTPERRNEITTPKRPITVKRKSLIDAEVDDDFIQMANIEPSQPLTPKVVRKTQGSQGSGDTTVLEEEYMTVLPNVKEIKEKIVKKNDEVTLEERMKLTSGENEVFTKNNQELPKMNIVKNASQEKKSYVIQIEKKKRQDQLRDGTDEASVQQTEPQNNALGEKSNDNEKTATRKESKIIEADYVQRKSKKRTREALTAEKQKELGPEKGEETSREKCPDTGSHNQKHEARKTIEVHQEHNRKELKRSKLSKIEPLSQTTVSSRSQQMRSSKQRILLSGIKKINLRKLKKQICTDSLTTATALRGLTNEFYTHLLLPKGKISRTLKLLVVMSLRKELAPVVVNEKFLTERNKERYLGKLKLEDKKYIVKDKDGTEHLSHFSLSESLKKRELEHCNFFSKKIFVVSEDLPMNFYIIKLLLMNLGVDEMNILDMENGDWAFDAQPHIYIVTKNEAVKILKGNKKKKCVDLSWLTTSIMDREFERNLHDTRFVFS
eukprot:snap_masked-scaffold_12-processed-gene-1.35-mRNA-1 protein AED:1.00 eAED:1.00 QI:0/-1/0/0/-1/1/1/0/671